MKNSKRLFVLVIIITGMIFGGFLFPPLLKFNLLDGAIAGALGATLIISILSPNFVNEINPNLSDEQKKRLGKLQFHGFKRTILHPTRFPVFLGVLWGGLIFLIISNSTNINLLIFLPILFFFGFSGYQMVTRNEYIGRDGNYIRGFPAKLLGYFTIIFFWGFGIFLILTNIFGW